MQNNINILNELREMGSTVLVNTDRKNIYFVPSDYFSNFSQDLLSRIFIESIHPVNPFTVPAGYFENLSDIILEKLRIRKNFQGIDGLEKMPYSIPDGYFNDFATSVLQKIKAGKTNPVQAELAEIAPLLSKLPKVNVYSVPPGYFGELDPIQKITEPPVARIIPMGSKVRNWINYAAAACVAAILLGGGYMYIFNNNTVENPIPQVAASDVQKGISELTDDEIAIYLQEDNSTAVYTNQSTDEQKDVDIKTLLENTSDEEIQQYLINNADPGEKGGGI